MTTLEIRRYYEQPWRWGMTVYWVLWIGWLLASHFRDGSHAHTVASSWQLFAGFPPFVSMALFGLYTGQISIRGTTINRKEKPVAFWLCFATNLLLAAIFLIMGLLAWHE